jgi:hypothetical protein
MFVIAGSRQAYDSEPLAIPVTVHGCDKLRSKKGRTRTATLRVVHFTLNTMSRRRAGRSRLGERHCAPTSYALWDTESRVGTLDA